MANPTVTSRVAPGGYKLEDGFVAKLTPALDPDISFWEMEVTPAGIDAGDAIATTTMHNSRWRTKAGRALVDLTEVSCLAAYDPAVEDQILAIAGVETSWTVRFSDGSTQAFYGALKSWIPNALKEGEMPTCNIVVTPTNFDPVAKTEQGPLLTSVAGT